MGDKGECLYPAWLAPGARVTIISGRPERTTETVVERVGKRDIVLANGQRFTMTRLQGELVRRQTGGSWDPDDLLVPTASEQATKARAAEWKRRLKGAARAACEAISQALRNDDLTAANEHYANLGGHLFRLREATNTPGSPPVAR